MPDSTDTAPFGADNISGPSWPNPTNTRFVYEVALPGEQVGRAVVPGPSQAQTSLESVAAALNFQVEGFGYEAVVEQLALVVVADPEPPILTADPKRDLMGEAGRAASPTRWARQVVAFSLQLAFG